MLVGVLFGVFLGGDLLLEVVVCLPAYGRCGVGLQVFDGDLVVVEGVPHAVEVVGVGVVD